MSSIHGTLYLSLTHLCQPQVLLTLPPKLLSTPFISHYIQAGLIHSTSPLSTLLNSVRFTQADCFLCLQTSVVSHYSVRIKTLIMALRAHMLSSWTVLQFHLVSCLFLLSIMPQSGVSLLYVVHMLHAPSYHRAFAHAIPTLGIAPLILCL